MLQTGCVRSPCPHGTYAKTTFAEGHPLLCTSESDDDRVVALVFRPTGEKREQCPLHGQVLDGPYLAWHENGTLFLQGSYHGGLKQGRWFQWSASGQKVADAEYRDGQLLAGAAIGVAATCETQKF